MVYWQGKEGAPFGFWIFMLLMSELIPSTALLFGLSFQKHPPKEINDLVGYRTAMSMKNRDTWTFAHRVCGKLWVRLGTAMAAVSAAVLCALIGSDTRIVGFAGGFLSIAETVILALSVIPVERRLKKTFDRSGLRREGPDMNPPKGDL